MNQGGFLTLEMPLSSRQNGNMGKGRNPKYGRSITLPFTQWLTAKTSTFLEFPKKAIQNKGTFYSCLRIANTNYEYEWLDPQWGRRPGAANYSAYQNPMEGCEHSTLVIGNPRKAAAWIGLVHRFSGFRLVGFPGQANRWLVSCGVAPQVGQL